MKEKISACIKTFMRPGALRRLLKSIRRYYPEIPIVVVDDGRPYADESFDVVRYGVEYIKTEFDTGACFGRNLAVASVKTPYLLLVDDDHIVTKKTDLRLAVEILERNPTLDLLGFELQNHATGRPGKWRGILHTENQQFVMAPGFRDRHNDYDEVDGTQMNFVAHTDPVRKVGWNETLRNEHWEFFYRFKQAGFRCGYTNCLSSKHQRPNNPVYQKFRGRACLHQEKCRALSATGLYRARLLTGHTLTNPDWLGPAPPPIKPGPIAILGCWKSGTSLVVRMLNELGVSMDDSTEMVSHDKNRHHERAVLEDSQIHATVTAFQKDPVSGKISWDRLQKKMPFFTDLFSNWRRRQNDEKQPIGIGHPALCMLGPAMLEAWGQGARYIRLDRSEDHLAASLHRAGWWNEGTRNEYLHLVREMLLVRDCFLRTQWNVVVVRYRDLLKKPQDVARCLAEFCDIQVTNKDIERTVSFIKPEATRQSLVPS